jgi:hypothetical protein
MDDRDITPRVARANREAALEKHIDDLHAVEPRDAKPLIAMACLALAVAAVAGTMMWMNNSRYDGTSGTPVAEQLAPIEAPQRQQ